MKKTVFTEGDDGIKLVLHGRGPKRRPAKMPRSISHREPIHVIYGGAHLYSSDTPSKLARIALKTLDTYVGDHLEFAAAMDIPECRSLPKKAAEADALERALLKESEGLREENFPAWLASQVYRRTKKKLEIEPIEDLRIDFEDGYGTRDDDEEDLHAERASQELAASLEAGTSPLFTGIRVKPYSNSTRARAKRTLRIFLRTLTEITGGTLPDNFLVTLPKVTDKKDVASLERDLRKIEKELGLGSGRIGIEIMVEHPSALFDRKGNFHLRSIVDAARDRCVAAHFGAYDYTASLGIVASEQNLDHPSCDLARNLMLAALRPAGIRLSDSVTATLPVALHKDGRMTNEKIAANKAAVFEGWRLHFSNVTRSLANGFFQSWDLHPNQLVARYGAVYRFFLISAEAQGRRLQRFIGSASQATLTGTAFDDAATAAGIVNFFRRGLYCGALNEEDVTRATGMTPDKLNSIVL